MARHNIIFGRDREVRKGGYAIFGSGSAVDDRQQGTGRQAPQYGQPAGQAGGRNGGPGQQPQTYGDEDLEALYAAPSATGRDTGRMTMRDALNSITATLGIIIVVGVMIGMAPGVLGTIGGEQGFALGSLLGMGAIVVGLIGGLITGLVNAFKKNPSAPLVLLYAVFQGMLLGGISGFMEQVYPGIALQAVLATFAVAATVLVGFRMNILRTSPLLTKIFMVAMVGYLLFCLVNIGFLLFTGQSLRDGLLGLIIGGLAVVMASYLLVMDFEDIQRGVKAGVQRSYAWRCAFGVAATLVWMYIEILRIIAILRGSE